MPAPLIICESRSLAGVLRATAELYACHIASTNGQTKGFLITDVVPMMEVGQRILYFGNLDLSGGHIEMHSRSVLIEYGGEAGEVLGRAASPSPKPSRRCGIPTGCGSGCRSPEAGRSHRARTRSGRACRPRRSQAG